MEQQKQLLDEIRTFTRREAFVPSEEQQERESEGLPRSSTISTSSLAQAVSLLALQISEFDGTDQESVHVDIKGRQRCSGASGIR